MKDDPLMAALCFELVDFKSGGKLPAMLLREAGIEK